MLSNKWLVQAPGAESLEEGAGNSGKPCRTCLRVTDMLVIHKASCAVQWDVCTRQSAEPSTQSYSAGASLQAPGLLARYSQGS